MPRRTARRGPQHLPQVGSEAPSCHAKAGTLASERGCSFATPSRHGGSKYVLRESVDHRANPPKDAVVEGKPIPSDLMDLRSELAHHARVLVELREDAEYERNGRHTLASTVQRIALISRMTDRQSRPP